ncbi:hypothetical protein [Priestia megaterium]|uniref:hypothetical protein n=1 Tax=Priestia megaterium TaxID=1404 RepID=UPI00300AD511
MDPKLYAGIISAIISAIVAFLILFINIKIIEPKKEARKLKEQQLTSFYGPMYVYIRLMSEHKFHTKKDDFETKGVVTLTAINEQFRFDKLNKLVIDNGRFIDETTFKYWTSWQINDDAEAMSNFCKEVIKKYCLLQEELTKATPIPIEKNYGIPGSTVYIDAFTEEVETVVKTSKS